MVLTGAGRPGGAVHRDVQLVACRDPAGRWRASSPDKPGDTAAPTTNVLPPRWRCIEVEKRPQVIGGTTRRHTWAPRASSSAAKRRAARAGEHDDLGGEVAWDDLVAASEVAA